MNTFGKDFYPTPRNVVEKMIEPWSDEILNASILDPSAGSGNILDYLKHKVSKPERQLFAIELNADLQNIVKGKKYRFLCDDFLLYGGYYSFDFIIMNPPFSAGARHLLKAWEVARNTKIACLLNAETIDNPCTDERQLLKSIIEQNGGTVEYLGDCFSNAERKTGVNVALVRLEKKTESATLHFNGEKIDTENVPDLADTALGSEVAKANYIQALVDTYKAACAAAIDYCKAASKYRFYATTFDEIPRGSANEHDASSVGPSSYNEMVEAINKRAWHTLFKRTDIKKLLTSAWVKKWNDFQQQQGALEFNVKNINEVFDMLIMNRGEILTECLIEVFDKMTAFHEDNKLHTEGWKTNDAYMVNRKVILPRAVSHGEYMPQGSKDKFKLTYEKEGRLTDIDKAMCLLTGKRMPEYTWKGYKYERIEGIKTIKEALEESFEKIGYVGAGDKFDNTAESEFFRLKFWKKGTLHFEFKDDELWKRFNIEVARGKGWLMGSEGQSYQRKKAA